MNSSDVKPIIVTAKMDDAAQAFFDELREKHFPAEINYLKAHLTLFHKLPEDAVDVIKATAGGFDSELPMSAIAEAPYFLGNGVAVGVNAPALVKMRNEFSAQWTEWLTPQDKQPFRPHITVQNKVSAGAAKALLAALSAKFSPLSFKITGLELWYYAGGPWEQIL